ncbi:hypothetical protein RZS08_22310, partial [Arthrospira platensis SPKY1]|nr:hypothetical protein [Arthrospira platensis SPKY1]
MLNSPRFAAPQRYARADEALAQVQALYQQAVEHLRTAMQAFVHAPAPASMQHVHRVRACYPFVRLHARSASRLAGANGRLSYGFVAGPGRFETTLTRPDLFADYYLEQFQLLLDNHGG